VCSFGAFVDAFSVAPSSRNAAAASASAFADIGHGAGRLAIFCEMWPAN
jgi:hypothetical protein